ncbi:MAG: translation initiation factor IF-2 [Pseudomonadota bacterium]
MTDREPGDRRRGSGGGSGSRTLGLRSGGGGGGGAVRQSFSHGRSKSVVVETKSRKRVINKPKDGGESKPATPAVDSMKEAARKAGLSEHETQRRLKALEAAKVAEAERKKREAVEAARRAEREAQAKAEEEERKRREAEETARRKAEEKAAEEERLRHEAETAAAEAAKAAATSTGAADARRKEERPAAAPSRPAPAEEERRAPRRAPEPVKKPSPSRGKGDDGRRSSKLTIARATSGDAEQGRMRSEAAMRRRLQKRNKGVSGGADRPAKVYRDVVIPEAITVQELARRMTEAGGDVVKALMKMGVMARINDTIDQDTAELIVTEFGHRVSRVSEADVEDVLAADDDPAESKRSRAPVVTVMGHVDHGKTSLLDALRKTSVVSGEAGGITQHIGAYQVRTDGGLITFLDTPGHAAFTSMRSRGAQVTDIVILVVAADDSVMPQTVEAISHAKAAEVPMIVAINKIDKPAADAQKVRVELLQHDVQVEGMGGEVLDVEVSAHTGQGLDQILENITLQAELLDLKANPDRVAEGAVIEAKLDTGRGPVATVLVQRGTLNVGDVFVVGEVWGKVRALVNDQGERVKSAGPSVPVEVLGLNGTPEAGDTLNVVEDEAKAREIADYRMRQSKNKQAAKGARATLDQLLEGAKRDAGVAKLPILIKGDVQGSVEAIVQALEKIGNDEVMVQILHSGVGAVTESDVTLAEASNAPIIGFNVRANAPARDASQQKGVEIRYYSIIYDLVDDVKAAASGLLSPEVREKFIGYAAIKQVFTITGVGKVAGCEVTEGVARREAGVRLLRDNVVIHTGKLKTLKRFKDEVKEVPSGQECGMAFERYEDIREGDVIEIFETEEITRTL